MSLTKLSYDVIIPAQGEFGSDIPAGDGKLATLFLRCSLPAELVFLLYRAPSNSKLVYKRLVESESKVCMEFYNDTVQKNNAEKWFMILLGRPPCM
jgi:hypothetical protein